MRTMFYFGVTLKSSQMAADWDRVLALLSQTLRSMLNQTDRDFRVMIACHERPEVPELADPRVEVLTADFPPPFDRESYAAAAAATDEPSRRDLFLRQRQDQETKYRMLAVRLRQHGGGYLMFVDADDLVHKRLVEFVKSSGNRHGFIIKDGYEFDFAANRIKPALNLDKVCGTCAIFHFEPEDLPEHLQDGRDVAFNVITRKWHPSWEAAAGQLGRPLQRLPFRAAVYVRNNNENISALHPGLTWRRKLLRFLLPSQAPSRKVRDAFAL